MCKLITLIVAACLALPAADNADPTGAASGRFGGGHFRQRLLERFDTDKDGKLSESERAAARAALAARLKERHPELLAKIDTNGDGVISKEEMQAARALLQAHRREHRGQAAQK